MDPLYQAGLEALRVNNRRAARHLFAEALKSDLHNPTGWLWLATCVDSDTQRAYCLSRALARQFAPPEGLRQAIPEASQLTDTAVAGVMFENHPQVARLLRLGEAVRVRREPANPHDANAVRVERQSGQRFGYLARSMAAQIAPCMDAAQLSLPAVVTQLAADASGTALKVHIAFYTPAEWVVARPPLLEYWYEESDSAIYLLLNCDESLLSIIKGKLYAHSFGYTRSGMCYRPASNGRPYQWYLRFEKSSRIAPEHMETFFREQFQVESERARSEALERIRQQRQAEIEALRTQLADTEQLGNWAAEENSQLQARLQRLESDLKQADDEKRQIEFARQNLELSLAHSGLVDRSTDIPDQVTEVLQKVVAESLTLYQSLAVIAHLFADRVEVLGTAWKSADDAKAFRDRRQAFVLLWKLVTEYWTMLANGTGDAEARLIFGDNYAARESDSTEKNARARQLRTFQYKGQPVEMMRHLKIGIKQGNIETLRIYFHWDSQERKLVIGHCGKHLDLR